MKPLTLAIVGRPNVGKSTLFNVLTKTRNALVVDTPGVTRDRLYGQGVIGDVPYQLIDTCGVFGEQAEVLTSAMHKQLLGAIEEADAVLFLVDAKAGLMPEDITFAGMLRESSKPVYVIVNKTDGVREDLACNEFYELGFDKVLPIAAAHKRGIASMIDIIASEHNLSPVEETEQSIEDKPLKIAVVGRPNVGKSTLINRMLKEERVVVYDMPGTTRDSIYIPLKRYDKDYVLIDTAGLRRKARVHETIEKFSVIKTLQAVSDADTVIMVLNANEDVFDQDLNLLRYVLKIGRSLVIAVNKWDSIATEEKAEFKKRLKDRLGFLSKVRIHTISALHGTGVGDLFDLAAQAHVSATQDLSTSHLSALLEQATQAHQPPYSRGGRIRLKYAHCSGQNPIKIVIHGNQTESLPDSYKKYIEKYFANALQLVGAPLHVVYKTSDNPYKGRRNKLTKRQMMKRKRLMKFHKKRKS